jgi:hypothetical protein
MDLQDEAADALKDEYLTYLDEVSPRKGRVSSLHSHFNRTSIWFDVRPQDAGEWFRKIIAVLESPEKVVRSPEPFHGYYKLLEEMDG